VSTKKTLLPLIVSLLITSLFSLGGCTFLSLPQPQVPVAAKIYGAENRVITSLYKENRIEVPIEQIPVITQKAFVAVEDARFYKHFGLDPVRILGAFWNNFRAGKIVQGGSTITQQTVKNLYLSREKTFGRKFAEAWLAIQLERKYSKKQILEMYLNQIYFGQGAYGIETAAQTYFNKPASALSLAESAMLAGLPKAPNTYSPFTSWEAAKKRQQTVLARMVETGLISQEEADAAARQKLILRSAGFARNKAAYFVNEVIKYVTEKYEDGAKMLLTEGLSVYTTLDPDMQAAAEESFKNGLAGRDPALEGALVAIDPANGYIKAMVGGRDFSRSQFNRAVQAKRQPGSAFKPFLYTAAIDLGYTQGSTLTCEPAEFPQGGRSSYKPSDYGANPYHYRPFTLKEALAVSDNVVSVKLANEVGVHNMIDYAHKMGIKSELRPYLSLALGTSEVTPLELAGAYGTLASMGVRTEPVMILKIVDRNGKVLEENKPVKERAIPRITAYLVTDMLTAVLQPGGTASSAAQNISRPAAGKTGTTQNYHDAWFVGYTPDLVAAIYIGYDSPNKSVGASGGKFAAPIWAKFMTQALKNKPPAEFPVPQGIIKVRICADSGLLATPYSPNTLMASFLQGTEPQESCYVHYYPGLDFSPDQTPPGFFDWLFKRRGSR